MYNSSPSPASWPRWAARYKTILKRKNQSKKFASIPLQHQWRVGESYGRLYVRKDVAFLDRNGTGETFGGPVLRIVPTPCPTH